MNLPSSVSHLSYSPNELTTFPDSIKVLKNINVNKIKNIRNIPKNIEQISYGYMSDWLKKYYQDAFIKTFPNFDFSKVKFEFLD